MKKTLITLLFSFILGTLLFGKDSYSNPGTAPKNLGRPSVALVLSGGGINGSAEIPVIEEIEKLGIPVDIVLGTSIGSIVGGLYSAGYTTEQLYSLLLSQKWPEIFADFSPSIYEEFYDQHGLKINQLPIKVGMDGYLQMGKGLTNGQKAYEMLKILTIKYPSNLDFDTLPIPFRAVATDMMTGKPYLFRDGDLAEAIRSSMNVGGLFEPLNFDGRYLLDGGLSLNLPVNIAKQMGYDIVIAVEIAPAINKPERDFETAPVLALENSIYAPMRLIDETVAKQADLLIAPDLSDFSIIDFDKAPEIYAKGKEAVEAQHEEFVKLRDRIYGNKQVTPQKKADSYSPLNYLTITKLEINNSLDEDISLINKIFNKIENKEYTIQTLNQVLKPIYETGHYKMIRTRIITLPEGNLLQINCTPKAQTSMRFLLGANVNQTVSGDGLSSYVNTNAAYQLKGFCKADSLLSIRGTFLQNWGASIYYFQPITSFSYFSAKSDFLFESYDSFNKYMNLRNDLTFGLNFLNNTKLDHIVYYNINFIPKSLQTADSKPQSDAGFKLNYHFNFLNQPSFAERGVFLSTSVNYLLPLSDFKFTNSSLLCDAEFKAAIPAGEKNAFGIKLFGGWDFTGNLKNNYQLTTMEAYSNYDRIYFPQIAAKSQFSTTKYAAALSYQYRLVENVTIAGGTLYFTASGTWGSLSGIQDGLWSIYGGLGLRIVDSCNVILRTGAANNSSKVVRPFVSFDIGKVIF